MPNSRRLSSVMSQAMVATIKNANSADRFNRVHKARSFGRSKVESRIRRPSGEQQFFPTPNSPQFAHHGDKVSIVNGSQSRTLFARAHLCTIFELPHCVSHDWRSIARRCLRGRSARHWAWWTEWEGEVPCSDDAAYAQLSGKFRFRCV